MARQLVLICFSLVLAAPVCVPQPSHSFFGEYNQKAAFSDPEGIQKYSEDLVGLIVPEGVEKSYTHSLSKRLAKAEQMAREGKGKLVPEAAIVRSFDDLMEAIGASPKWRADITQIRHFRARAATAPNLSALFSAGRNGTNCNPGEAVLLLDLLITNNGRLIVTSSDFGDAPANQHASKLTERTVGPDKDSSELLAAYSSKHSHHDVRKLFDHTAQTLGF